MRTPLVLTRVTDNIYLSWFCIVTYTDHYKYPASHMMVGDFERLHTAGKTDKPTLFVDYCRKAIGAKEAGTMPLRDAAYSIARTMFVRELDEPLFDELTGLAGELELPPQFVNGDREERWQKLIALVDEYDARFKDGTVRVDGESDEDRGELGPTSATFTDDRR